MPPTRQAFEWRIFDQHKPLDILGVNVVPLPVHHGKVFSNGGQPYYCMGFLFDRKIAYLSDLSGVPDDVWNTLERECPVHTNGSPVHSNGTSHRTAPRMSLEALVIDCLRIETFTSHFGLVKLWGQLEEWAPRRRTW